VLQAVGLLGRVRIGVVESWRRGNAGGVWNLQVVLLIGRLGARGVRLVLGWGKEVLASFLDAVERADGPELYVRGAAAVGGLAAVYGSKVAVVSPL